MKILTNFHLWKLMLFWALLWTSSTFMNAQNFEVPFAKANEFIGVSTLPNHGYAFTKVKNSQIEVEIRDLEGNQLVTLKTPHKVMKLSTSRLDKPKVYFNGSSYLVLSTKKMMKHYIYSFDLIGKNIGKFEYDGNVQAVNPIENGYVVGYAPKIGPGKKITFTNNLKKKWEYRPSDASIVKYKLNFILAGGKNITSKYMTLSEYDGTPINQEFRYTNAVAGSESRYLFERVVTKGGKKGAEEGIVCLDASGKKIFSDIYGEKERNFLHAVSHNESTYVLYRKYPEKGGMGKSIAEIIKYNAQGKVEAKVTIDKEKFPVVSDYMNFYMEKTSTGVAILGDARGYFYGVYLNDDLEVEKKYAFEGKSYKAKNKEVKLSAIGSFPSRCLFSGTTDFGTPYLLYLDLKMGKETVRCTSFAGKDLLPSDMTSAIEKQIEVYYAKRPLMGGLKVDYGDVQSHHEIYRNLVQPKDNNSFVVLSYFDRDKTAIGVTYKIK